MKKVVIYTLLLIFVFAFQSDSYCRITEKDTLDYLIEKIVNSKKKYSYTGDVIIKMQRNEKKETLNKTVWFLSPDKYREELITPDNKHKFVHIWNGNRFITILDGKPQPPRHRRRRETEFPMFLLRRIKKNFDIKIEKGEKIADRETEIISLQSRIPGRRNFMFWIDDETGVMLKRIMYGQKNDESSPFHEMSFTTIQYNPAIDKQLFEIKEMPKRRHSWKTQEYKTLEEAKREIPFPVIVPEKIPDGFVLDRIRVTRERHNETIHLNYSNGITSFSIFQSFGPPPPFFMERMGEAHEDNGEIVDLSKGERNILFKKMGPLNITVIGNCPKELLYPVIENMYPPKPDFDK